jgi:hypothetical protein
VYFNESSFLKNTVGVTKRILTVIQKFRDSKIESADTFGKKPTTICGTSPPTITKYDMETPKHFTATAKSKNFESEGYVIEAQLKNEAFLPSWDATRLKRYNPRAESHPQINIIPIPPAKPVAAKADGIATIPDPNIVLARLMVEENTVPLGV